MDGRWCVRYGDALAWVEASSAPKALRRSLDLYRLGDWTDDARELVVFPQDDYPDNAGPHDYTRAVLRANPPRPRHPRQRAVASRSVLTCAAVVTLGFVFTSMVLPTPFGPTRTTLVASSTKAREKSSSIGVRLVGSVGSCFARCLA